MHVYSQILHLPAGQSMAGYSGERRSTRDSDELEVNGWSFTDAQNGRLTELCSIDALYAGGLVETMRREDRDRIFAASHTHYAPMLDGAKPQLGALAHEAVARYASAIDTAARVNVEPDVCRIHRAEVAVPIYRRFDVPDTALNRFLTSWAGMFPNAAQAIDRHLYVFEFAQGQRTLFTLIYHGCHPVSRHDRSLLSPDYIGAVRRAVRARFSVMPSLFLLGCAGDVRPHFARKRVAWLPRNRFNWRFEWPVAAASEASTDKAYAKAVRDAELWQTLPLNTGSMQLAHRTLALRAQGDIDIPCLQVGECLRFEFVPFEVSQRFHLEAQQKDPMRFIVSCTNHVLGYLPHPSQLRAGGYEVDGSRGCMGLRQRVELKERTAW